MILSRAPMHASLTRQSEHRVRSQRRLMLQQGWKFFNKIFTFLQGECGSALPNWLPSDLDPELLPLQPGQCLILTDDLLVEVRSSSFAQVTFENLYIRLQQFTLATFRVKLMAFSGASVWLSKMTMQGDRGEHEALAPFDNAAVHISGTASHQVCPVATVLCWVGSAQVARIERWCCVRPCDCWCLSGPGCAWPCCGDLWAPVRNPVATGHSLVNRAAAARPACPTDQHHQPLRSRSPSHPANCLQTAPCRTSTARKGHCCQSRRTAALSSRGARSATLQTQRSMARPSLPESSTAACHHRFWSKTATSPTSHRRSSPSS